MCEIEKPLISVLTPLWNQEELLPEIARRLGAVFENVSIEWQWVAVDNCSSDHNAELVTNLQRKFFNAKFVKLSRSFDQQGAFLRSSSSACHVAWRSVGVMILAALSLKTNVCPASLPPSKARP